MNEEIKTKWLEALRSGEYKQTTGRLRNSQEEGFCCLGVLCDIMEPESWSDDDEHQECFSLPSNDILVKTGMKMFLPNIDVDYTPSHLSTMNDHGSTFTEIADWIEAYL